MGRAPCCEKMGLKKGRWTAEEDEILSNYIQANGEGSWRSLPKNAGLLRCGKSCRLRWINYLRADIKRGNFSVEEQTTIVKLHASVGNRWSLIASHLPGRTDNEIKNYWNSHLSRKIYGFGGTSVKEFIALPPRRKRGRTSRWALKNNKSYAKPNQTLETEHPSINIIDFINVHHQQNLTTQEENVASNTALVQSLDGDKHIINHDVLLGPNEEQVINDMMVDNCWQEPSGGLVVSGSNDVVGNDGTCTNSSKIEELHSSSSMASGLDDGNWDLENLVQFDPENLLTWLCEDDDRSDTDFQSFREIDPQKQNAMIDWLIS
ncbi:hypothetical protein Fmac_006747 [Flemingia macrophylla]|uniref:Uncharacterized protein n=1 Tax=Flemingia macrophylla TaxID=520843 RepID=A0ABD1NBH0_9FABA